jgi:hypothetical protein
MNGSARGTAVVLLPVLGLGAEAGGRGHAGSLRARAVWVGAVMAGPPTRSSIRRWGSSGPAATAGGTQPRSARRDTVGHPHRRSSSSVSDRGARSSPGRRAGGPAGRRAGGPAGRRAGGPAGRRAETLMRRACRAPVDPVGTVRPCPGRAEVPPGIRSAPCDPVPDVPRSPPVVIRRGSGRWSQSSGGWVQGSGGQGCRSRDTSRVPWWSRRYW